MEITKISLKKYLPNITLKGQEFAEPELEEAVRLAIGGRQQW